jgi:copper homeostasis protein CutC
VISNNLRLKRKKEMDNLNIILELCVGSVQEAVDGEKRGASRIELCANLAVGGISPTREDILSAA